MRDYQAALDSLEDDADGTLPAVAPAAAVGSAPAALTKGQRDRAADDGRKIAELERRVQLAEAHSQQAVQTEQERRQREWTTYLNALPPAQREVALARAEAQQANATAQEIQRQRQDEQRRAQIAASEAQAKADGVPRVLGEIAQQYGVQLTGQEEGLDDTNEQTYRASARALALAAQRGGEEDTFVDQTRPAPRVTSPRAAAGTARYVRTEDYKAAQWAYNSKKGPATTRQQISSLQELAARRVPR